jgi:hypothetical protein
LKFFWSFPACDAWAGRLGRSTGPVVESYRRMTGWPGTLTS